MNEEETREFTIEVLQELIDLIRTGEIIPRSVKVDMDSVNASAGAFAEYVHVGQKITFDFAFSKTYLTK